MGLINARVSEVIWYGMTGAITYLGLTMYKPSYSYWTANVHRI